jgi:hypothetical protein
MGRFVDPLSPNLRTEGNFQARFSRRKSIQCSTLYRLTSSFLRYVNISTRIFEDSVSCLGLYGGLYGQNLPYKFKNRMVISRIATSKNHIELLVRGQI